MVDWFDFVALPLFEAHASEAPFEAPAFLSVNESMPARRARWLASLLDVPSATSRKTVVTRLTELFIEFDHPNTFRVLSDLALDDVSADDLIAAYQLKVVWAGSPKLWCIRRSRRAAPLIPEKGQAMLTWSKATRLVALSKGLPAEIIIEEDWFNDWLMIPLATWHSGRF